MDIDWKPLFFRMNSPIFPAHPHSRGAPGSSPSWWLILDSVLYIQVLFRSAAFQDSVLLVELSEVPVSPTLQPVEVALDSIILWLASHSCHFFMSGYCWGRASTHHCTNVRDLSDSVTAAQVLVPSGILWSVY